jgi:hypothetical protein
VVFPMAERTTTGVSSRKLRMRPATSRIRSADASDEPPNFMTKVNPAWAFLAPDAAAGASSILRKGAAVDPVWQRTARPLLRLKHYGPGFVLAGAGSRSLPSLEAATGASRERLPRDPWESQRHRHLGTRPACGGFSGAGADARDMERGAQSRRWRGRADLGTAESRLEGVNRANLKFTNLSTTTSRVSVRNINESEREGTKQIMSK